MFAFLNLLKAAKILKQKTEKYGYFKVILFQISVILLTWLVVIHKCENSIIKKAANVKYITSTFDHPADLGNMLFRFASLYGIGKELQRIPYVNGSITTQLHGLTEISEYFPTVYEIIQVKVPPESIVQTAKFADECCTYESPKILKEYDNAKYLKLTANYLQSYKYFHNYQHDVMKLMECSSSFEKASENIAETFWNKEAKNIHKICVHVRRGDFVQHWPLETRMDFTLPALQYIYDELKEKNQKNFALLFLGNDQEFIDNFNLSSSMDFETINNIFAYNTSRSFDMCFGIRYCDSLLISASASTYGWWIGYLMKSQGPVYYNAIITKSGTHAKDIFDYDLFPPKWQKLMLHNGTIIAEDKWTAERNKL